MKQSPYKLYITLPAGGIGLALLMLALLKTGGLVLGTTAEHRMVLIALTAMAVFALLVLVGEGYPPALVWAGLLPIALALFLRVFCLDHITQDYELFLSAWVKAFREGGGFDAVKENIGNYNAPYLYFMAAISGLKLPDLYAIKLFSILFDFVLAWGALRLTRVLTPAGSLRPLYAFFGILLLPTVIFNGSFWGQCDAIYGAFLLHAVADVLDRKPARSVLFLAVAFSFKLQTIFLVPLWCAFWFSGRVKFYHLLLFPFGYFATILPALWLGKPLADILGVYLGQLGEYADRLTLNAPSVYALLPYGLELPTTKAAHVGIAAAFLLTLSLIAFLFRRRTCVSNGVLLSAAVLLAIGIPFFLPYMHERYFFLADIFAFVWAFTDSRRTPQAAAVQAASLGAYHAYLTLTYLLPVKLAGHWFQLGWEALLLLVTAISSSVIIFRQTGALSQYGKFSLPDSGQ